MKFFAAFGLALGLAAPALASGPYIPTEPAVVPLAPVAYNWAGTYAGLGVSAGSASHTPGVGAATLPNSSGIGLSGVVGYNAQRGNTLFGVELNFGTAQMDGTGPCTNPAFTCASDIGAIASLRGRIGWAQDRTMYYVGAGVTAARVTHSTQLLLAAPVADTQTLTGATIALGVEHALNNNGRIRAEIEHTRFGGQNFALDVPYTDVRAGLTRVNLFYIRSW